MSSTFRLLITTDISGEVWNYTVRLCESLMFYIKADILMAAFGGKLSKLQEEEAKKLDIQVKYADIYLDKSGLKSTQEAENYLIQTIKDFKPHILHLNHYMTVSDRIECPVIITSHEDLISLSRWTKTNIIKNINQYRQNVRKSLNSANTVVLTSRFAAECLFKEYNFNNKFKVIYNGINIEPAENLPDTPCILAEGNLNDRSKNIILLSKIADKIPGSIKIRVIGRNNYERNSKKIEWLSNLSDEEKIEAYKKSSIFLALSSYETFGLSSMIAAYSNCAILANDIPFYNELWGDCACIFERNDLNSFIRNLNNIIENEKLLTLTAKNCRSKALSSFNLKRMGMEYVNLYRNILQKSMSSKIREEETQYHR